MPLSDQEKRCIEYACEFLSSAFGGRWNIESYLDELNPTEPTPEVVVTNGEATAAIEVKRMPGDSTYQEYMQSLISNQRYLSPSCGGYYYLQPPVDMHPPLDKSLRRQVKQEIERVAPTLKPGEKGVLSISRSGHISLISNHNPPLIMCSHGLGPYSDLLRPLLERLEGRFMLVDEGLQHSFFTNKGKEAFYEAVSSACKRRLGGDASPFSWNEEWQITRLENNEESEDGKDGVWILACTEARSVPESIKECLQYVLDNALRKFIKRWANQHILILEESVNSHAQFLSDTIAGLNPTQLPNIDYVLLVANSKVVQCYPQPS